MAWDYGNTRAIFYEESSRGSNDGYHDQRESNMREIKWSLRNTKIDWKWVGIGYCFFVVFHLLPSYLIMGFPFDRDFAGFGIWLFVGLAIIAFYIGYRSRGITILEPTISAILYDITLLLEFNKFWGRSVSHSWGTIYVWGILTLTLGISCAWLGEIVQSRKQAKAKTGS